MSVPVSPRRREDGMATNLPLIFSGVRLAYAPVGLIDSPATLSIVYINVAAGVLWGALGLLARSGRIDAVRWLMFAVVIGRLKEQPGAIA